MQASSFRHFLHVLTNPTICIRTNTDCCSKSSYALLVMYMQEITADTGIEIPDVSVAKQLMRQHVRNLLGILSPKERRIIKLRFGIEGGEQKSLSEIGDMFRLSKERVRQLENRALYKLKQCLGSHGLNAYSDLLV